VIQLRHQQPSLGHKGLAKDIEDLWEPWMREVDQNVQKLWTLPPISDNQLILFA